MMSSLPYTILIIAALLLPGPQSVRSQALQVLPRTSSTAPPMYYVLSDSIYERYPDGKPYCTCQQWTSHMAEE